jgi:group I intron endonuclease
MGYIYKITNLMTKKMYIRQTYNDIDKRFKDHFKKNSNCRYLKNAFEKYGKENFKIELVLICFDEDLNNFEIEYIKKYNTLVPNGYNLRNGGNNGKHHEETKIKISKILKNYYLIHPHTNTWLGKTHTEETKKKISDANKGRKLTEETITKMKENGEKYYKKVVKIDPKTNNILEEYINCTVAAKKNNTSKAAISMVCNGKRIQLKGYIYKYIE